MAIFAYDPSAAKTWANAIINYINGGAVSISSVSKRFDEQIEALIQPNVWTGDAASKNYQNFLDTHQALVNFSNSFGQAFEESMNSVNTSVSNLEISNLGTDSNVSSFGGLSFEQLKALTPATIATDVVRYDYAKISGIGEKLNTIQSDLDSIYKLLESKINELDSGSSIWDGDAAGSAKTTLLTTLKNNMDAVMENLTICISNIRTAAEAAEAADSSK